MKRPSLTRISVLLAALGLCFGGAVCQPRVKTEAALSPGDPGYEQLAQADRAFAEGRYEEAIAGYRDYLDRYPEGKNAVHALEKTGEAYYHLKQYSRAAEIFGQVLERFPDAPEAVNAAWGLSLLASAQNDCATVNRLLGKYRERAAGKRWDQMTMLLADCCVRQGQVMPALHYLAEETEKGDEPEIQVQARSRAQELILKMSDSQLETVVKEFPSAFPGDFALLQLITRAVAAGKWPVAANLIAEFEAHYPDSPYRNELQSLKKLVEEKRKARPNRIGVLLPLSGQLAPLGEQTLLGIMLAGNVLTRENNLSAFEFIVRNAWNEQEPLDQTIQQLVQEEQVIAIIGPLQRRMAERAAAAAEALAVPLISLSPSENLSRSGRYIYQNYLSKAEEVETVLNYAITHAKISRFAVLYPNSKAGQEYLAIFQKAVTVRGGMVTAVQTYATNQNDFKNEIKALKTESFKALFIPDPAWARVALIAPQLRYYGLTNLTILGVSGWRNHQLLARTNPQDLEGAVFPEPLAPESTRPEFLEFSRRFQNQFGYSPGFLEAYAYESASLIMSLVQSRGISDREELKLALDQVRDFPGVLGPITVDPDGKFVKQVYLYMINNGKFNLLFQPA